MTRMAAIVPHLGAPGRAAARPLTPAARAGSAPTRGIGTEALLQRRATVPSGGLVSRLETRRRSSLRNHGGIVPGLEPSHIRFAVDASAHVRGDR